MPVWQPPLSWLEGGVTCCPLFPNLALIRSQPGDRVLKLINDAPKPGSCKAPWFVFRPSFSFLETISVSPGQPEAVCFANQEPLIELTLLIRCCIPNTESWQGQGWSYHQHTSRRRVPSQGSCSAQGNKHWPPHSST